MKNLERFIDHAPLFPPAAHPAPEAVRQHRLALADVCHPALNTLVWPVGRLDELVRLQLSQWPNEPRPDLRLAALAAEGAPIPIGRPALGSDDVGSVEIVQVETVLPPPGPARSALLDSLAGPAAPLVYFEVPVAGRGGGAVADGVADLAADLAADLTAGFSAGSGVDAGRATPALKVRCGGLDRALVPTADELAAFVVACVEQGLAFKATAGLHHAWPDLAAEHPRHGLASLLLAVDMADSGADRAAVAERLADPEPAPISPDTLARARRWFASLGTCSFREPLDGLGQWLT